MIDWDRVMELREEVGPGDFAALCKEGEFRAAASDFGSIDINGVLTCFAASKDTFVAGLAQRMAS